MSDFQQDKLNAGLCFKIDRQYVVKQTSYCKYIQHYNYNAVYYQAGAKITFPIERKTRGFIMGYTCYLFLLEQIIEGTQLGVRNGPSLDSREKIVSSVLGSGTFSVLWRTKIYLLVRYTNTCSLNEIIGGTRLLMNLRPCFQNHSILEKWTKSHSRLNHWLTQYNWIDVVFVFPDLP